MQMLASSRPLRKQSLSIYQYGPEVSVGTVQRLDPVESLDADASILPSSEKETTITMLGEQHGNYTARRGQWMHGKRPISILVSTCLSLHSSSDTSYPSLYRKLVTSTLGRWYISLIAIPSHTLQPLPTHTPATYWFYVSRRGRRFL